MRKIIMDCAPGHDDAIALLLASRSSELELLGVTTVAGNSELHHTTRNAKKILDYADVTDVDVYPGCERPMMRELYHLTGAIIHGEDGLGGPKIPDPVTPVKEEHGVDFIIRMLRESEEKITLIHTGPLTNIAMAQIKVPDIKEKIDRIVIMGGAVTDPGNITSGADDSLPLSNGEKMISVVAAMDIPVLNDFIVGYIQGVVNTVPETKVAISYIGDFNDTAKAQFKLSSCVSFNVAAQAGLGMIGAAAEEQKYAIGVGRPGNGAGGKPACTVGGDCDFRFKEHRSGASAFC